MTLLASVGQSQALDGREAGLQATHKALNRLGTSAPSLGIVIASHQYEANEVSSGVTSLLGEVPILGFSSPAGLTSQGQHPHSVIVALLSSPEVEAETHWLPGYLAAKRQTNSRKSQPQKTIKACCSSPMGSMAMPSRCAPASRNRPSPSSAGCPAATCTPVTRTRYQAPKPGPVVWPQPC